MSEGKHSASAPHLVILHVSRCEVIWPWSGKSGTVAAEGRSSGFTSTCTYRLGGSVGFDCRSGRWRTAVQKFARLDTEGLGELLDDVDAGVLAGLLYFADLSAVEVRFGGQVFLRPVALYP